MSLQDLSKDFRVGRTLFKKVRFAVFGLGSSVYEENFCRPALEAESLLTELGATCVHETGQCIVCASTSWEGRRKAYLLGFVPSINILCGHSSQVWVMIWRIWLLNSSHGRMDYGRRYVSSMPD